VPARARGAGRPEEAPYLGIGVGLRPVHYAEIFERSERGQALPVDFFEVLSENFMVPGGKPLRMLDRACALRPVVQHGVALNIGSTDPLDEGYLDALDALARRIRPHWISDHLCWTGVSGQSLHDLLPLPYADDVIDHVARRVRRVQERLGRRIALENVSSYMSFADDAMPEWEFLTRIVEAADCGILLDVNNVFVSAWNHGFEPRAYIDAMPAERVFQIHLAGHSESPPLLIDTHDHPVREEVWDLYAYTLERLGPVSTSIEWDDRIPPFATLLEEVEKARKIAERLA
jgi:uncharacterized protein (UPF0276 family)